MNETVNLTQKFDWPDVPDAASYEIGAGPPGVPFDPAFVGFPITLSEVGASVLFTSPVAGTYNVQVRSVNIVGKSDWSIPKNFDLVGPGIPDPPVVV